MPLGVTAIAEGRCRMDGRSAPLHPATVIAHQPREQPMPKYRIIAGTHRQGRQRYRAGDVLEMTDADAARFTNKFEIADQQSRRKATSPADAYSIEKVGRRWRVLDGAGEPVHEGTVTKKQARALIAELS